MRTTRKTTRKRRIRQPHEVRYLDGRPINWNHPPKPGHIVGWPKRTTLGRPIKGSFWTLCHLNRLNNMAKRRFGVEIQVIQPDWNTGVAASAGTHDADSTWDLWIPGVDPWVQQRFFRANGLGGWMRRPPKFGWHYHGFSLPRPEGNFRSDDFKMMGIEVGVYVDGGVSSRGSLITSSQITDYYNHAFGLAGMHTPGSDKTWFPKNLDATVFNLKNYVEHRARLASQKRK